MVPEGTRGSFGGIYACDGKLSATRSADVTVFAGCSRRARHEWPQRVRRATHSNRMCRGGALCLNNPSASASTLNY